MYFRIVRSMRPECGSAKLKVIGISLLVDAHWSHRCDGVGNTVALGIIFGFGLSVEG